MRSPFRKTGITTVTSVFRTSRRLRVWIVPWLIVVPIVAGWWIRRELNRTVTEQTAARLLAILDANVAALRVWLEAQESAVSVLGHSERVRGLAGELERLHTEEGAGAERLLAAPEQIELRRVLDPMLAETDHVGYVIHGQHGVVLAASRNETVGQRLSAEAMAYLAPVMIGQPVLVPPFLPSISLPDRDMGLRDGLPTMAVAGPVRDDLGRIVASLVLIIRPEADFTRLLGVARMGQSDETYAFDAQGVMVSHSRFDEQLRHLGLLPEDPALASQLRLEIRDPGGDLTRGFEPAIERRQQPLTRMAASAVSGQSGVDVDGYRDYRGVEVVGAWTWLEGYRFGVATEIDHAEALRMPAATRRVLWIVLGLLALGALVILAGTTFIQRLGRKADKAIAEARTLGQYTLLRKIGEGGMGEVYRARHALLRRPTVIKLLHQEGLSTRSARDRIARFEREVQLTSQLTHPNTIEVYDYGVTPDGVFYYAMELLKGVGLGDFVIIYGPMPEGRVIHVLKQVCGSLAETHDHELIHRDIKPDNIYLCERGGIHDMAKVLDFGIVKDLGDQSVDLTTDDAISCTPHYVSPEGLRTPSRIDARADLYSLGAVAYYLVTGRPVFDGETVVEVCTKHLQQAPSPLSEVAGRKVAADLEAVILSCLTKDPDERPGNARELARRLAACEDSGTWGGDEARDWWQKHPELGADTGEDDVFEGHQATLMEVPAPD